MATTLNLNGTSTNPAAGPTTVYRDMWTNPPSSARSTSTDEAAGAERPYRANGIPITFYSERVANAFTLSGAVTFEMWAMANTTTVTGRLRARLYKITAGGSDIKSLIGTADATSDLTSTIAAFTFNVTPAAVAIAPGERLILAMSLIPTGASGSYGTGTTKIQYGATGTSLSTVTLTETVTFLPNELKLLLRRTATIGIGGFFDLLETPSSSAYVEAKTVSVPSGTEIQWTKLAQSGTVAVTELTGAAIANTSNLAAYTSASFTPVANRLYLLAVVHSDAAPETTEPTIATTTGLTFVQLANHTGGAVSQPFDTVASNVHKITLFRAMKASGLSAGTYTVNFADAGTGCAAMLVEVTGVVTSGTDGANAVRNVSMGGFDNQTTASIGGLMATFLETYNGTFLCVGANSGVVPTPSAGFTALSNPDYLTPTTGLCAAWKATADEFGSFNFGTSVNFGMIGLELIATQTSSLIEWISQRFSKTWSFDTADKCAGLLGGLCTSATAKCGLRVKLFHRAPNGTETLVYTNSATAALGTNLTMMSWLQTTGTLNQVMTFKEDDRLVLRVYLINIGGTMVGGETCSIWYDDQTSSSLAYANASLYNTSAVKLESDPAAGPAPPVPGTIMMGGVGN